MKTKNPNHSRKVELVMLLAYAVAFYIFIIRRSLEITHDHSSKLYGLRPGWLFSSYSLNDVSDAQWRNFRSNLPILTVVFGAFAMLANTLRAYFHLKARGMSIIWLFISLIYLCYLHGACIIFVLAIASLNFLLVKIFAQRNYFPFLLWIINIFFLLCTRVYEGYSFSIFGQRWTFLDNHRGTFRWHICFNFVILRMISFGYDYHGHIEILVLIMRSMSSVAIFVNQENFATKFYRLAGVIELERNISESFSFSIYLCYLVYAPLYIAGPIINFNAFASQLEVPQNNYSSRDVVWYGLRWIFGLFLMELMTHLFYYNAFAISGMWKLLSPLDVFIIGYGVRGDLDCFMLFLLDSSPFEHLIQVHLLITAIYKDVVKSRDTCFKLYVAKVFSDLALFSVLVTGMFAESVCGIETPENMPRCLNNCHNLETFWKNWHASFNKWLVRYLYIPLGGSRRKLLNVWVIFTFVAIWHDLEWKLLSWAWLTCLFFVPEMVVKSAANSFQAKSAFGEFLFREFSAIAGAITITCLMIANLVGYVVGPSGINWLISRFPTREGLPVLSGMFITFYVGTKLMFHIEDAKQR
ncbi:hypothetical protein JRO89_XS04G0003400 [Xanthoceras sorbifolium]|uniref:Membrane-bound O-acyltransferase C24H6.01c n=1 Tax=Xanthoceras sorbifolium TaxID=99658 RepID=A0ABQ8I3K9_9ROSI|nr:hypothetical protein JRO89_XS04G0003400 [Xanthoceras sorbifolium]